MRKSKAFLIVVMAMSTRVPHVNAQDRSQARSVVMSRDGIVAAESPLAAQAGATILARGGNAVDAAVTANAVMGVVAPMMNGMGGDLFAIVYDAKSRKLYGLNASGWAPRELAIEFLRGKGFREMPAHGIHSITVPGAVDGWSKLLSRFGRKKFPEVLAAAIHYAETGFPVTEIVARDWEANVATLRDDASAVRTFLPDGRAPHAGEVFHNPDLARSLRQVAEGGRDAFYKGEIAKRILAASKALGGTMAEEDLAEYSSEWVEPISATYRGWTVSELPPNGQGIAALEMLNLLEQFPLRQYGHNSADTLHAMIEAKKLAYADLWRYVADPKYSAVPVAGMLSKDYARGRAKQINMAKASCDAGPGQPLAEGKETTYLSVVDRDGNMVSLIQSNFDLFGSGVAAEGTGFVLQNRGALFRLDPAVPNALAGRKRPLHTIIPGFLAKDDVRIAFGIMGGFNQAQAHAQFVANVVDFGMNIQAALEAARFTKKTFGGCDVEMESRIPAEVRATLEKRGHQITVRGDFSSHMGGGQAVQRDFSTGVNFGASDPRKDGEAIPEPIPE